MTSNGKTSYLHKVKYTCIFYKVEKGSYTCISCNLPFTKLWYAHIKTPYQIWTSSAKCQKIKD